MSRRSDASEPAGGACQVCRRRCWLLGDLSALLDYHRARRDRLSELLALSDEDLIEALAGSRRESLRAGHRGWAPSRQEATRGRQSICRHDPGYPRGLRSPGAPWMLNVAGGIDRLLGLLRGPAVAILGARSASDYGVEMAVSLGRGLAAAEVTVLAGLDTPIGRAAHEGALLGRAGSVAVLADGLGVSGPAAARAIRRQLMSCGCAVSELPWSCRGRSWGTAAGERIVVGLSQVAVLVEAEENDTGLAGARLARSLGRPLAAVPGMLTSPLAAGPNSLLAEGAHLIRGAGDILDLLHDADGKPLPRGAERCERVLDPRLGRVLARIGAGSDTVARLAGAPGELGEVLAALGELEAIGLLRRTVGGRYVRRDPVSPGHQRAGA